MIRTLNQDPPADFAPRGRGRPASSRHVSSSLQISSTALITAVGFLALGPALPVQAATEISTSTVTQRAFELAMVAEDEVSSGSVASSSSPPSTEPSSLSPAADALRRRAGSTPTAAATRQVAGPDGLPEGAAYMEADRITTIDDDVIIASGSVEMRYKGNLIRADQISYNSANGEVIASGNTQTIGDDGAVQFADRIIYNEEMSTGQGDQVASQSPENAKLLARKVLRIDENTNQLQDVIYTPCELCVKDGVTQEPSWSIQATEITQRKDHKMVYYRNALMRIKGVPVFYSPFLWTPDPDMDRASGLLAPKINTSRRRGFSWEQPYLWAISPYSEMIISPQLNASVNPLLNLEYNRRFYSGNLRFRVGATYESFFDNRAERYGERQGRGYILADGDFRINDDWHWSFTAQQVEDPYGTVDNANFFDRYNIEDPYPRVGEFRVDNRVLINQAHITRHVSNAWFSMSVANFQSLKIADFERLSADTERPVTVDSALYPAIGPMIDAQWSPQVRLFGGRATFALNAIGLQHKLYPGADAAPLFYSQTGISPSGFDTARATVTASWAGNLVSPQGIKVQPFVDFRQDYYRMTDLGNGVDEESLDRGFATAGLTLSYPLIRKFETFSAIIEPVAQVVVSPEFESSEYLPFEDSQFIEFDGTNLFSSNHAPGYDLYEGGARLNIGLRGELRLPKKVIISGLIGQTLRSETQTQYYRSVAGTTPGTVLYYDPFGIAGERSDWVIDGRIDTGIGIYAFSRLKFDPEWQNLVQNDSGFTYSRGDNRATFRYLENNVLRTPIVVNDEIVDLYGDNYRNLQFYARYFITDTWGVSSRIDYDLRSDKFRRSYISAIYRDDCLWLEVVYQKNDTRLSAINGKPQASLMFRLNLATIGSSQSDFRDVR